MSKDEIVRISVGQNGDGIGIVVAKSKATGYLEMNAFLKSLPNSKTSMRRHKWENTIDSSALIDIHEAINIIYDVATCWIQNKLDYEVLTIRKCAGRRIVFNDIAEENDIRSIFLRFCLLHPDLAHMLLEHESNVFGKWKQFINISQSLEVVDIVK